MLGRMFIADLTMAYRRGFFCTESGLVTTRDIVVNRLSWLVYQFRVVYPYIRLVNRRRGIACCIRET